MSQTLYVSVLALVAACSSPERQEPVLASAPTPAPTPTPTLPPAPAPIPVNASPTVNVALTGPASPEGIEAIAAGTYDVSWMVTRHRSVVEVIGATVDPSTGKRTPRATKTYCADKAKARIIDTAKWMVERAVKYDSPIECDHTYVTTPDPTFGALPATATRSARPGHGWRYAVCTSVGVASYDSTIQVYYQPPDMDIVGILVAENASASVDEDLATLDGMLTAEIVRCP